MISEAEGRLVLQGISSVINYARIPRRWNSTMISATHRPIQARTTHGRRVHDH